MSSDPQPDPGPGPLPEPRRERPVLVLRARAKHPVVTIALLVLFALVFLLELAWGGADRIPVLGRMGAMTRPRLFAGEVWRCMSSGVLHGSVTHIALNSLVLWRLGVPTERLLGNARFLVLYVTSALVAALGSALVMHSLSVGASGAIWGLLGAQTAIAFGAGDIVPVALRPELRRAAASNVVVNAVVSFLPHVDWAAHFSGGVTGAALLWTGLLLPGATDPGAPQAPEPARSRLDRLAALLGALYLAGALFGVLAGRAWLLTRPLEFAPRELPALEARASLPTLVGRGRLEHDEERDVYAFGEVEVGPLLVFIGRIPHGPEPGPTSSLDPRLVALRRDLSQQTEEQQVIEAPATLTREGRLLTVARSRYPSGMRLEVALWIGPSFVWRVETLTWPEYEERCAGSIERIAGSIEEKGH